MDPNSQPTPAPAPAPAEPAAPAPAAPTNPEPAPAAPAAPAVPATIDPVDHSAPTPPAPADPAAPPADPAAPVDPNAPPADPNAPAADPDAPIDAATLAGDIDDEPTDPNQKAIQDAVAAGQQLPSGVNDDGTVNPLVYAYEQMPEIKVTGRVGKGEVQEFTVKTADDLPDGFRFADAKVQSQFNAALTQNMNVAQELINEATQYNSSISAAAERRQVLVGQKSEVDALVASGRLPEMKLKPTDPNFMQDPGAQRAQQVLDHMAKVNKDYADRGINQQINSVEVALQLLEAQEAIDARDGRMGKITDTRTDINGKINGNGNGTPPASPNGEQHVHKDVNSALRAAKRRHGI